MTCEQDQVDSFKDRFNWTNFEQNSCLMSSSTGIWDMQISTLGNMGYKQICMTYRSGFSQESKPDYKAQEFFSPSFDLIIAVVGTFLRPDILHEKRNFKRRYACTWGTKVCHYTRSLFPCQQNLNETEVSGFEKLEMNRVEGGGSKSRFVTGMPICRIMLRTKIPKEWCSNSCHL